MYNVIKTEAARQQIDDIVDYMVAEFANVDVAIEFLLAIDDALSMIARYPRSGKKHEPQEKLERIYHIKLVKRCKLFYTVDDDKKEICIAYVFHDLQSPEGMF